MQYETLDPKNQKAGPLSPQTPTCANTHLTLPTIGRGPQRVPPPPPSAPPSVDPHPDLVPLTTPPPPRAFNFGEFLNHKAQQPLPPSIASHESQISAFRDHCYHLTLKLNTLLGIGLQVTPPDFFTKARTPPSPPPPLPPYLSNPTRPPRHRPLRNHPPPPALPPLRLPPATRHPPRRRPLRLRLPDLALPPPVPRPHPTRRSRDPNPHRNMGARAGLPLWVYRGAADPGERGRSAVVLDRGIVEEYGA